jgi:predicted esterase
MRGSADFADTLVETSLRRAPAVAAVCVAACLVGWANTAGAIELSMKDGRVLRGKMVPLPGMVNIPTTAERPPELIRMLDDDLRRTYLSKNQIVAAKPEQNAEAPEKFVIKQPRVGRGAGKMIKAVGLVSDVTPFDEFGRRSLKMRTPQGPIAVVQAITEITPSYTKVEAILPYVWEMRLATSSLDRAVLEKILAKTVPEGNTDGWRKIARFHLQCERYDLAIKTIDALLKREADNAELKSQLEPALKKIREATAQQILSELKLRREAGQHRMVYSMLSKFPTDGATGETIQAVREVLREYDGEIAACKRILSKIDALVAKIGDAEVRKAVGPIVQEIHEELGINTRMRMAAFVELGDDESLKPEERVALAISCWLVGRDSATTRISTAMSLVRVRQRIRDYFAAENNSQRTQMLPSFQSEEGANMPLVAQVLANMKPPVATEPQDEDPAKPYALETPARRQLPAVPYLVQLPPEYDPYRKYPAIVTLHGAETTPAAQIDWWAGGRVRSGVRLGHATRRGYIVIAPAWMQEEQEQYGFSAREHFAVLDALRDACRRFSIDTDRVFLTGHSTGGDAAWDIGLAHPDLWAGVIPLTARSDRYVNFYRQNAKLVPFYFVIGELDPGRTAAASHGEWDQYFIHNFNVTVVEYLGRGHDHFSDEILRLFDWMGRFRRDFYPKEFKVKTMRSWDSFFWWLELGQLPPRTIVDPEQWASRNKAIPSVTEATLNKNGDITVTSGAAQVVVWLSPEMLDVGRKIAVKINGRKLPNTTAIAPQLSTLLEDVRLRGDRQHPFWAKVETTGGRPVRDE